MYFVSTLQSGKDILYQETTVTIIEIHHAQNSNNTTNKAHGCRNVSRGTLSRLGIRVGHLERRNTIQYFRATSISISQCTHSSWNPSDYCFMRSDEVSSQQASYKLHSTRSLLDIITTNDYRVYLPVCPFSFESLKKCGFKL